MAVWLCRSGRHYEHESKFVDENRIYLTWEELDRDLSQLKNQKELMMVLKKIYPNKIPALKAYSGQIWAFSHRMSPGDWVCVPSKRKNIHIGQITGDYTSVPNAENPYYHYRAIEWLEMDVPRTNFDQDILYSLNVPMTICQIKRNDAEDRVRAMQGNDWKSVGIKIKPMRNDTVTTDEDASSDFDLEQTARDQLARLIFANYHGHGLESLVEAILKAQGFTTYHSGKGPDGGIDILAAPGILGFDRPRICIQVKSQATPLERPVLDQLVGTMQHVQADQGLLVCWGGFKPTIKKEEARLFFSVRLWDQNDLVDQFLTHYENLDEDLQAEIPLKRIWVVASQDDGKQGSESGDA